jgi:hypothetical protein
LGLPGQTRIAAGRRYMLEFVLSVRLAKASIHVSDVKSIMRLLIIIPKWSPV